MVKSQCVGPETKVLQVITRAERGGAQVHVLDLVGSLRKRCDVEVAVGEEGFLADAVRQQGLKCHIVPSLTQPIKPLTDARCLLELRKLIWRLKPDLVHAHTSKAGILVRMSAKLCRTPAVFTAHTWCFAEGASLKWKIFGLPCERFVAKLGGVIINVSEANSSLALRHNVAPLSQMTTIHNGIPDNISIAPGLKSAIPTIIMVARFVPQKDQELLLDAAATLAKPFKIEFIGDGPTKGAMERKANQLGLTDQITFLGDRSDVPDRLHQAAIFALPSKWEGFPLSILEAMRAGLPVVASNVGGVSESVVNGLTGTLVPPGDSRAFARALSDLLQSPSLREQMGARGRQLFEQAFTISHMVSKTISVYERSLSRNRFA